MLREMMRAFFEFVGALAVVFLLVGLLLYWLVLRPLTYSP